MRETTDGVLDVREPAAALTAVQPRGRSPTAPSDANVPDPDDRHVLAAAVKSGAQTIVTANLRDFPPDALNPWNVEARSPDDFVVDQIHLAPAVVHNVVQQMADAWTPRGTRTFADVLTAIENRG